MSESLQIAPGAACQSSFKEVLVPLEMRGARLDRAAALLFDGISRSAAASAIRSGRLEVIASNGVAVQNLKTGTTLVGGEVLRIFAPEREPLSSRPENIPLDIRFEDDDVLVVNKPAGMVVHPAPGHAAGTLVNALAHYCSELSRAGGEFRPGIVHRVDKNTSGLLVVAKNDRAHANLAAQLAGRTLSREYMALVWGHPQPRSGRIDASIGRDRAGGKTMAVNGRSSRVAATQYETSAVYAYTSVLILHLETGRTHQIRVHLKAIGHPVVGDPEYGGRDAAVRGIAPTHRASARRLLETMPRQALHARKVVFLHPADGQPCVVEADPPADFADALSVAAGAVPRGGDFEYFPTGSVAKRLIPLRRATRRLTRG